MTRFGVAEVFVEDPYRTLPASGALAVDYVEHVRRTADEAEILFDALADVHATVQRAGDHQNLVDGRTLGAKVFRLADGLLC